MISMNFLEEITKLICKDDTLVVSEYRYINIDGKYLYIEGIIGIKSLGEKEIEFKFKKKSIKVVGDDMKIKYFDNSTVIIEGRIIQTVVM